MSGGVDSSTVAAILKRQGHDIIGLSMQLWNQRRTRGPDGEFLSSRCCSLDDIYDARRVAQELDFPFYVINLEEEFERSVVQPFVDQYLNGQTPIPCVACNSRLKFDKLLELAEAIDAEKVATGHYARVEYDRSIGRYLLRKGLDRAKDQSYFLFDLTQEQLARTLFPLGGLTKSEVRRIACENRLPVAEKAESQEICFIPDGDYARFIENYVKDALGSAGLPAGEGEIVSIGGKLLGKHNGVHHYTIGQRRRLGIAAPEPLYVVRIESRKNRVVVGTKDDLLSSKLVANRVNWIAIPELIEPIRISARVRYRHLEAPATVYPLAERRVQVEFDEPQRAITPGQAVVFYDGDLVVGGGWIAGEEYDV